MESLKEDTFMKWNNTEFTNACSFTLFLVCGINIALSFRIHLLSVPIDTILPWLTSMFAKISSTSAYQFLSRPTWCWLLFWWLWFIRSELNWILYFWYPGSCQLLQKFFILCFLESVQGFVHVHLTVHSLQDATAPSWATSQFSSELSNNCSL